MVVSPTVIHNVSVYIYIYILCYMNLKSGSLNDQINVVVSKHSDAEWVSKLW